MARKTRRQIGIAVGVCAAVLLIGTASVWVQIAHAATIDNPAQADAVVVLGCAVMRGGKPSPALRARIEHGITIWRQTRSHYLLLSGGVGKNPPAEAEIMAGIARRAGVPQSAILEDTTAHRTEDSAAVCARMASGVGWTRVVIVSDPWHMLRAHQMFVDADPALDVRQSPATDSPAWTDTGSRTGYMLRECVAFPVYSASHFVTGR